MDKLTSTQKIFVGIFTVLVMIGLRAAHYFFKDIQVEDFIVLGFAVLTALGVTHLGSGSTNKEGGFAGVGVLLTLALGALLLAGCTTVMRGYESAAANEIRQSNDNILSVWKEAACAMPVGAVLRDPAVIETVNKFCGGGPASLGAAAPINVTIQMPAQAASAAK